MPQAPLCNYFLGKSFIMTNNLSMTHVLQSCYVQNNMKPSENNDFTLRNHPKPNYGTANIL